MAAHWKYCLWVMIVSSWKQIEYRSIRVRLNKSICSCNGILKQYRNICICIEMGSHCIINLKTLCMFDFVFPLGFYKTFSRILILVPLHVWYHPSTSMFSQFCVFFFQYEYNMPTCVFYLFHLVFLLDVPSALCILFVVCLYFWKVVSYFITSNISSALFFLLFLIF